jgi:hypothetical protein
MTTGIPGPLIINSPYAEPKHYWKRDERTGEFFKADGRRPAGYVVADPESKSLDDPGRFIKIELVEPSARVSNAGAPTAIPARPARPANCSNTGGMSNPAAIHAAFSSASWRPSRPSSG